MDKIQWNSSYSVGVTVLDKQHQKIIDAINNLLEHSNATVRSETISNLLSELTQYAQEHFITEESILSTYGYDKLEKQKQDHKKYRLKIVNLCMDAVDHRRSVPEDLRAYITSWWKNHILVDDMAYKSFFENLDVDINEEITNEYLTSLPK